MLRVCDRIGSLRDLVLTVYNRVDSLDDLVLRVCDRIDSLRDRVLTVYDRGDSLRYVVLTVCDQVDSLSDLVMTVHDLVLTAYDRNMRMGRVQGQPRRLKNIIQVGIYISCILYIYIYIMYLASRKVPTSL